MQNRIIIGAIALGFALLGCRKPKAQPLKKQTKAPAFSLPSSNGKTLSYGKPWKGIHLFVFYRGSW